MKGRIKYPSTFIKMKKVFLLASLALILIFSQCNKDPNTYVAIDTDFGTMKVVLYNSTPKHKANFIKLVKKGYYDGLLFHRVMQGFMIQGGDPDSKDAPKGKFLGLGGPGYTISAEIGAPHIKGTLAAARLGGAENPLKQSSGSQFYIVQGMVQNAAQLKAVEGRKGITYNSEQRRLYTTIGGTPALDGDYTVFGQVVEGLEVIDKIAAVRTDRSSRPLKDVKMKIRLLN